MYLSKTISKTHLWRYEQTYSAVLCKRVLRAHFRLYFNVTNHYYVNHNDMFCLTTQSPHLVLFGFFRKWLGNDFPEQQYCKLLNISECHVSENSSKFMITLYNPLSHSVTTPVRIPVKYADYNVTGPNGII